MNDKDIIDFEKIIDELNANTIKGDYENYDDDYCDDNYDDVACCGPWSH